MLAFMSDVTRILSAFEQGDTRHRRQRRRGGIHLGGNSATVKVKNSSTITGNTAPAGSGADVYNYGVVYLDSSSSIAILDGNPAKPI